MNLYSIASAVATIFCFVLGTLVFVGGFRRPDRRTFGLATILTGVWTSFPFLSSIAPSDDAALGTARLLYMVAAFVPVAWLYFMMTVVSPDRTPVRKAARIVSVATGVLFASFAFSGSFILGVRRFAPYFAVEPGLLFAWFIVAFSCIFVYVVGCVLHEYRATTGIKKNQMRYIGFAYMLGFFSGVLHFGAAYFRTEPFPHDFLIISYVSTIAYAVVRYRLLDLNVAIARTVILAIIYALVLGVPFVMASIGEDALKGALGSRWWYVPLLLSTCMATLAPFIFLFFQRKAEARLLREQRHYQSTLLNAAKGMTQIRDLQHLLSLIVHMLTRSMKLTHAGVFMQDGRSGQYVLQASRDRDVLVKGLALDPDDFLIAWLKKEQAPLVSEEIRQMVNGTVSPADLEATLKRIGASVVVPSFAEDQLIGFLVLGDKKTGRVYSQDDLNTLQTLANQAALAVQNARFYEELQTKTAELLHESRLKSMGKMASGMSHQIHNRLMVLAGEASLFAEMYLPKLRAAASESERQVLLDKLETTLQSIGEESVKGKEIVKKLLDFSKPATNRQLVPLRRVVEGGLRMVSLNHQLEKVDVRLDVLADQLHLEVNFTQLEDVFFNLFDNALDAIKGKVALLERQALTLPLEELPYQGTLTVTASPAEDHTRLLVRVSDNGLGMSPEDEDQLFLPFFTTKGTAEKGTGMGLFIIREILRAHGGEIRLERADYGVGTTFLLELPLPTSER